MNFQELIKTNPEFLQLQTNPIAYFCAEFALEDKLPLFSGGLGVLAGDVICEAGQTEIPFVAIGLLYKEGYFKQIINDELQQVEEPAYLDISTKLISKLIDSEGRPQLIELPIADRIITAQIWEYRTGTTRVLLLDTDVEENHDLDRRLTVNLYPTDSKWRIQQEMVLGLGGVKALAMLDIKPSVYHLNEGHSSFAVIEIARQYANTAGVEFSDAVRYACSKTVFTNHTLLPAGNDIFNKTEVAELLEGYTKHFKINPEEILKMGIVPDDPESFSMTLLAFNASSQTSAVSKSHSQFAKVTWPEYQLLPITNGVNKIYWQHPSWKQVDEELQNRIDSSDLTVWETHTNLKKQLFEKVESLTGVKLDPNALTITWARRITTYKQPLLIFSDIARLKRIISISDKPVQILIAGKSHPNDTIGKGMINEILQIINTPELKNKIVFIPNYNLEIAHLLTSGSDVWLNTPIKGQEACGTSGMKAAMNGVLQLAISDGWTDEIDLHALGFAINPINSAESFYSILEELVIPLFYLRDGASTPNNWVEKMKSTMLEVSTNFSSERMLSQYINELYLPILSKPNN